jgi:hypothetical protein
MSKLLRQGDVLLKRVKGIPSDAAETKDCVLARGEVTGHSHRIDGARVFRASASNQLLVEVPQSAVLLHEEHGPVTVPKGTYEVVRQREYDPVAERTVSD